MRTLTAIVLTIVSLHAFSQRTVKGIVVDDNLEPLSSAHVLSIDSTITDMDGRFTLHIPDDLDSVTIHVGVMGFGWEQIEVALPYKGELVVQLYEEEFMLPEVPISSNRPYTLMYEAIVKLRDSKPTDPFQNKSFYRQTHREDGQYVRLIEADVSVVNTATARPKHYLKIEQQRRSMVYEKNGGQHDDHLVDLLMENPADHPSGTILDIRTLKSFELNIVSECYDSTKIGYSYNHMQSPKRYEGEVLLDEQGRVVRIVERSLDNPKYQPGGGMLGSTADIWEFVDGTKQVYYSYPNNTLQLDSIEYNYLHNITDRFSGRTHYVIEEQFQLWVYSTELHAQVDLTPYTVLSHLYNKRYPFDSKFWEDYDQQKLHPLATDVVEGLAGRKPLSDQYRAEGK